VATLTLISICVSMKWVSDARLLHGRSLICQNMKD
jgi:hypothetical protein